jgi:hypothetical protein
MKSFQELLIAEDNSIVKNGGYGSLLETDSWINKYSRALIRAMKREKGVCYLLDIYKPDLKVYKRGIVNNFEFQFITSDAQTAVNFIKSMKEDIYSLANLMINEKEFYPLLWR